MRPLNAFIRFINRRRTRDPAFGGWEKPAKTAETACTGCFIVSEGVFELVNCPKSVESSFG